MEYVFTLNVRNYLALEEVCELMIGLDNVPAAGVSQHEAEVYALKTMLFGLKQPHPKTWTGRFDIDVVGRVVRAVSGLYVVTKGRHVELENLFKTLDSQGELQDPHWTARIRLYERGKPYNVATIF